MAGYRLSTPWPRGEVVERKLAWLLVDFDDPRRLSHVVDALSDALRHTIGPRPDMAPSLSLAPFGQVPPASVRTTARGRVRSLVQNAALLGGIALANAAITLLAKIL